jgi:hypothetical protein
MSLVLLLGGAVFAMILAGCGHSPAPTTARGESSATSPPATAASAASSGATDVAPSTTTALATPTTTAPAVLTSHFESTAFGFAFDYPSDAALDQANLGTGFTEIDYRTYGEVALDSGSIPGSADVSLYAPQMPVLNFLEEGHSSVITTKVAGLKAYEWSVSDSDSDSYAEEALVVTPEYLCHISCGGSLVEKDFVHPVFQLITGSFRVFTPAAPTTTSLHFTRPDLSTFKWPAKGAQPQEVMTALHRKFSPGAIPVYLPRRLPHGYYVERTAPIPSDGSIESNPWVWEASGTQAPGFELVLTDGTHTIDLDTNLNGDLGEGPFVDTDIALGDTYFSKMVGDAILAGNPGTPFSYVWICGGEGGDAPYADVAAVGRSLVRVE